MSQETWILDEIEVRVSGFFTTHHNFHTSVGTVGEFTFPAFSQHGIYRTPDGRELLMQKVHWLGTTHEVVDGDTVRGTADQPGLFRQDFAIQFDGQQYALIPKGVFKRGWYLTDAQGLTLLEIEPRGAFKQGAYVTIILAVDPDLVAFAYYLVHVRWQEAAAAGAAAAS